MAEITLSVSFGLLHALVERVKTSIPTDELAACVAFLDILVVNVGWGPEKQQVPLAVSGHDSVLLQYSSGYHVVHRTAQGEYALQALVRQSHIGQASSSVSIRQPVKVHYSKLSLRGPQRAPALLQNHPSISAVTAVTAARSAAWQLQQHSLVPPCKGLQLLPGTVTCCCVLIPGLEMQQQQQVQLQQLLQTVISRESSPNSQLLHALTAAAASAAAAHAIGGHAVMQPGPAVCNSGLYDAVAVALQTGGSVIKPTAGSVQSTTVNRPPCVFLVGSSTGQVWVCDPTYALLGAGNSNSTVFAAAATRHPTAQNPNQAQQPQQQQFGSTPRLLVDIQQPIAVLLPVPSPGIPGSSGPTLASSILIVGSMGRVGLLRVSQQQQEMDAAADAANQPAAAGVLKDSLQLTMTQQQLPFLIKTAHLLAHSAGHQQDQQQQAGYALLLLSSSGALYVADLTAHDAVTQADPLNGHSNVSRDKTLHLRLVKLELPARVSSAWVIPTSKHASASAKDGMTTAAAACTSSSSCEDCIIVQCQGGNELLQVAGDWRKLLRQKLQSQDEDQGPRVSAALKTGQQTPTHTAAAAASSTRRKLQGLMSALEILNPARQSLEQAIKAQDSYLAAVKQDIQLLKSLQIAPPPPAAAAAATASSRVPAYSGCLSESGLTRGDKLRLSCDVELQGLWPAPAAAGQSSSTGCCSMHMAVTVHLPVCSSSSSNNNQVRDLGFGSGWQLLISFMPESSHNPSWQTTAPATCNKLSSGSSSSSAGSGGSGDGLSASVLLPLPEACMKLLEGGWLQVYAVKEPAQTVDHAVAASKQGAEPADQQQQQQPVIQGAAGSLPAVALLGQHYISVLRLSRMLATNPAAAAMSAAAAAEAAPVIPGKSYSCILQLQAASTAAAGKVCGESHQQQQQQQQRAGQSISHKQSRANMQQATAGRTHPVQLQPAEQQPQQPQQEVLCCNLGRWLESIAMAPQELLSTSSSSSSSLSLPESSNRVSLFHGQVGYKLVQGSQGQLTWASRPLLGNPNTGAATAAGPDDQDQRLLTSPVQVGMQANSVAGLAQMHRAYTLAVVKQLLPASNAHITDSAKHSSSGSRWYIVSQKQQLQKALQQLKQLQQQLMRVQAIAEDMISRREQLLPMLQLTPAEMCQPLLQEAHSQPDGLGAAPADAADVMKDLRGLFDVWESELHAAYARMLQAMSTAACIRVQGIDSH